MQHISTIVKHIDNAITSLSDTLKLLIEGMQQE